MARLTRRLSTPPLPAFSLPSTVEIVRNIYERVLTNYNSLPEAASDGRLEAVVTNAFKQYGTVFVKIRRDKKNMPFAFAQFMVS